MLLHKTSQLMKDCIKNKGIKPLIKTADKYKNLPYRTIPDIIKKQVPQTLKSVR